MTTLYVVRPDKRGIVAYPCHNMHPVRGVEHGWTERPMDEPGAGWSAHACTVRVGTVCEHDWLCTDNLRLAQLVDNLYGAADREREAVVRYLRTRGTPDWRSFDYAAELVEAGVHHWESSTDTHNKDGK